MENTINLIINLLQQKFDIDLSLDKLPTINRGITRRIALKQFSNIREYFFYLEKNEEEQNVLYNNLLVSQPESTEQKQEIHLLKLYDAILEKTDISAFVVDQDYNLIHNFSGASRYLIPKGRASFHIFSMIDECLKSTLDSALRKAMDKNKKITYDKVPIEVLQHKKLVTLTAEPVVIYTPQKQVYYFVRIKEQKQNITGSISGKYEYNQDQKDYIESIQQELKHTKEYLRASKEELQIVNEKLQTVNAQYQSKVAELTQLNNDINNLLKNTDVGIIFLDSHFCVRKFTPAVVDIVELFPQDIGRPIQNIRHDIRTHLLDDVKHVQQTNSKIEKEIQYKENRWLMMKIFPYENEESVVDGVVLTLVDISEEKKKRKMS